MFILISWFIDHYIYIYIYIIYIVYVCIWLIYPCFFCLCLCIDTCCTLYAWNYSRARPWDWHPHWWKPHNGHVPYYHPGAHRPGKKNWRRWRCDGWWCLKIFDVRNFTRLDVFTIGNCWRRPFQFKHQTWVGFLLGCQTDSGRLGGLQFRWFLSQMALDIDSSSVAFHGLSIPKMRKISAWQLATM